MTRCIHVPQHLTDRQKGFAYLESFESLQLWTEDEVDPLQRANTPLLARTEDVEHTGSTSKVMLIHDYRGGYNDFEAIQGAVVSEEMYSCEYLNYVEIFVYFSHRLVTVPPPSWVNLCHRQGVEVLGTFIVEPGSTGIEQILEVVDGRYWVADRLARMASLYGFDGWLINIEDSFPWLSWSTTKLEGFLRQLRGDVGIQGKVVWYDAITNFNIVVYQNTLSPVNLSFALAAGSILTNYAWTPELARRGRDLAIQSGLGMENLYFGIDVWAQNTQHGRNRRITYPVEGGGGTGTGLGVGKLASLRLNSGIFAPGWSFEHFGKHHRAVERAIWLGEELPAHLHCECNPATPHDSVPYHQNSVSKFAKAFNSGSSVFFHTDFRRAFSETIVRDVCTPHTVLANLAAQSILPRETHTGLVQEHPARRGSLLAGYLHAEISNTSSGCALVAEFSRDPLLEGTARARLCIADLDIAEIVQDPEIAITYRKAKTAKCRVAFVTCGSKNPVIIEFSDTCDELVEARLSVEASSLPIRSIAVTFLCEDVSLYSGRRIDLMTISSITIKSRTQPTCQIADLRIERRKEAASEHHRLVWNISPNPSQETPACEAPYSRITGPCASFRIFADGADLGMSYALEHILPEVIPARTSGSTVLAEVLGIGFDGSVVARCKTRLTLHPRIDEDWVVIDHEEAMG